MSFAKLKELIGDNAEAIKIVDELESTSNTNVETINNLEKSIGEIKETRDKYKNGNSLVKNLLGLENINEETLNDYLSKNKKQGADETLTKEIDNLKKELENSNIKYQDLVNTSNTQIQDLKLGTQLSDLVGSLNIIPEARQDAIAIVKASMSFDENNNPIFRNEDGTTKYVDGKVMTLEHAVKGLEQSRPYMFAGDTKSGGGSQSNNGGGSAKKRSEMTNSEKGTFIKENGQEAYFKLPK